MLNLYMLKDKICYNLHFSKPYASDQSTTLIYAIFNTGNLRIGISLLPENETLIYTDRIKSLYTSKELRNSEFLKNIKKEY